MVFFWSLPVMAETLKVAVVDVQYCLLNSKEGKRSRNFLEKRAKAQGQELKKKEKTLFQKSKELQESLMLSPDQKQRKQEELIKLQQELRRDAQMAQSKFGKEQQSHTQKIISDLRTIIDQVAKKKGLDIVVEAQIAQGFLYTRFKPLDITKEVVKAYDKAN